MTRKNLLAAAAVAALALVPAYTAQTATENGAIPQDARETHLRNIKQLTFGGENAEAYFSIDGKKIIF